MSLIFTSTNSVASKAMTHVVIRARIFLVVFVALWAMRDGGTCAVASLNSSFVSFSAPQILLEGDGFKVGRIHAAPDPAQVINLESRRDWAAKQFVRQPVSFYLGRSVPAPVMDYAVTADINSASPQPAARIRFGDVITHQLCDLIDARASHQQSIAELRNGVEL